MSFSDPIFVGGCPKCLNKKSFKTPVRDKKTKGVAQLSFLIWILNKKLSFTFKKPRKRSTVNFSFPDLIEIDFEKDKMNIAQFLNEKVENGHDKFIQACSRKQTNRKVDCLRKVYLTNYLADLAIRGGVKIERSIEKDVDQIEFFSKIEFDGKVFDQKEIVEAGVEINVLMMTMLGEDPKISIPMGKLYELFTFLNK